MKSKKYNKRRAIFNAIIIFFSISIALSQGSDRSSSSSRGWELIFRQTAGFYQSNAAWELHNENDPSNDNYSILEQLEDFRGEDGKFHLKLVWPDGSSWSSQNSNVSEFLPQEWKQSNNPVTESAGNNNVTGYEAININYEGAYWGGLSRSPHNPLIHGSTNGWWFYAIGSAGAWNNGIPGPGILSGGDHGAHYFAVQKVELYAMSGCDDDDDDGICNDEDDCVGSYDECGVCDGPGVNECGVCVENTVNQEWTLLFRQTTYRTYRPHQMLYFG